MRRVGFAGRAPVKGRQSGQCWCAPRDSLLREVFRIAAEDIRSITIHGEVSQEKKQS
jgi:hypothetical protein